MLSFTHKLFYGCVIINPCTVHCRNRCSIPHSLPCLKFFLPSSSAYWSCWCYISIRLCVFTIFVVQFLFSFLFSIQLFRYNVRFCTLISFYFGLYYACVHFYSFAVFYLFTYLLLLLEFYIVFFFGRVRLYSYYFSFVRVHSLVCTFFFRFVFPDIHHII